MRIYLGGLLIYAGECDTNATKRSTFAYTLHTYIAKLGSGDFRLSIEAIGIGIEMFGMRIYLDKYYTFGNRVWRECIKTTHLNGCVT